MLLSLFKPQFPNLKDGDDKDTHPHGDTVIINNMNAYTAFSTVTGTKTW